MAKTVAVIGLDPTELPWLHSLVWLLRHPDPKVAELTRQAFLYLEAAATAITTTNADSSDRRDAV